jgi:hypothetical protein
MQGLHRSLSTADGIASRRPTGASPSASAAGSRRSATDATSMTCSSRVLGAQHPLCRESVRRPARPPGSAQPNGSVSPRASEYNWRDRRRDFLRRLATHSKPWRCGERSGACGGRRRLADWFGSGNGGRNEARRRRERIRPPTGALEPPHRAVTAFHAAVILLQPVIQILAVAMPNSFSPHRSDVSALLTAHSRGLSLNKRIRR